MQDRLFIAVVFVSAKTQNAVYFAKLSRLCIPFAWFVGPSSSEQDGNDTYDMFPNENLTESRHLSAELVSGILAQNVRVQSIPSSA